MRKKAESGTISKGEVDCELVLCTICGSTVYSKKENIWEIEWRPADRRAGGRAKWIKEEKGETEKIHLGVEFCLGGVWDESGQVPISVWRGEEFVDEKVGLWVGREENIGDVVQGDEFCNIYYTRAAQTM